MTGSITQFGTVRALVCDAAGERIASEADALDLIGEAAGSRAQMVVIPLARLDPRFFRLETGLAGALAQKLVNYGLHLVVLGDVSGHVARSRALTDFVRESNRGRSLWFCEDAGQLAARLGGAEPGS